MWSIVSCKHVFFPICLHHDIFPTWWTVAGRWDRWERINPAVEFIAASRSNKQLRWMSHSKNTNHDPRVHKENESCANCTSLLCSTTESEWCLDETRQCFTEPVGLCLLVEELHCMNLINQNNVLIQICYSSLFKYVGNSLIKAFEAVFDHEYSHR
jgi:hypothetical protein